MNRPDRWLRVTAAQPCPICSKPDFCVVGTLFINCMRVPSDRANVGELGGWLHRLDASPQRPVRPASRGTVARTVINAGAIMEIFARETSREALGSVATSLGVSESSLVALGCAWAERHTAWAFPMRNAIGETVGIRLRNEKGEKWAVTGSHAGLFYVEPPDTDPPLRAWVLEGPTDTAAALTLGLFAIGRPSCQGSEIDCDRLLRRLGMREVVIVADSDEPGQLGADKLQAALTVRSVIVTTPCKDLRQFLNRGGTRAMIESMVNSLVWTVPKR